jgi:hypothetical protein
MAATPHLEASSLDRAQESSFWEGKLGYPHAWLAATTSLAVGLALHLISGVPGASLLLLSFLCVPVVGSMAAVRIWRKSEWCHWLSGIPLAVSSTTVALLLALLGGVLPSSAWNKIGMPTLWESWPFLMTSLLVMVNLSAAVSKRAWPLTRQNVTFLLSHLGLLIAFVGGALSACLMERSRIAVFPEAFLDKAQTSDGGEKVLPFQTKLLKFDMQNFPPTLAVAKSADDLAMGTEFCREGMKEVVGGYELRVIRHLHLAIWDGSGYRAAAWPTATPASWIEVWSGNKKIKEGWIACGSKDAPPSFVELPDQKVAAMATPRPKSYTSRVQFRTKEGIREETIEVNKPARVGSWTIYQVSYDEEAGPASRYSVLEAVEDRAIPVVYLGMGLVALGAMIRLWEGVEKNR